MLCFPLCRRWARDTRGQDLLEYALLAGILSLGLYGGASGLGQSVDGWYRAMDDSVAEKREASQFSLGEEGVSIGPLRPRQDDLPVADRCTSDPGAPAAADCR
jgi:Flp pilus assembly pilin Flp